MTFLLASGGQPLPLFVIPLFAAFMLVSTVGTLLFVRTMLSGGWRSLAETYPDLHGEEREGWALMPFVAAGDGPSGDKNVVAFTRTDGHLCLRLNRVAAWLFRAPTRYILIPERAMTLTDEVRSVGPGGTHMRRIDVRSGEHGSEVVACWLPESAVKLLGR